MTEKISLRNRLGSTVPGLAARILSASAGELASLRRMDTNGPGDMCFWKLMAEGDALDLAESRFNQAWMTLAKVLALLTPRGVRSQRGRLHHPKRPIGTVLCDGGDPNWAGSRPWVSEAKLARFLSLGALDRGLALERLARSLAPGAGIDSVELAHLLMFDHPGIQRRVAAAYYRRMDASKNTRRDDEEEVSV